MAYSKFLAIFLIAISLSLALSSATLVSHDGRALTINGERKIILAGSIHYPRSTPEMWPDLIKKSKEGGLDAIETYVFWNAHEPVRRQYDFTGNNDLVRFIKTVQDSGLYAILRIGPYVCAEWNYGGLPVWLHNIPGIELRTANTIFMREMQNFTTLIVDMMKKEKLFATQGGPIILSQIENEYGNVISEYGDAGKAYINWCSSMAVSQDIGVPWIMCQQPDAPQPMINTCNGWYCDSFTPNNPNSPKMWTENWTGWFKNWGGKDPHRTAEDLAYSVARFFQTGGTLQNYYMYHGGTNFGRTAGGPYISATYDYDAPLDEYGNLNQPKWGHLKELHAALHSMEKTLTQGNVSETDMGNSVTVTKYATKEASSCFISNTNTTTDATVTYQGHKYSVPAWSVSVLPDCKTEVYNTAKVNTQTSVMVKRANQAEDEPQSLNWAWRGEHIKSIIQNEQAHFSADGLLDQKQVSNDSSDYVWYLNSFYLAKNDPIWSNDMKLRVKSSSHVLHVYVNGQYLGHEYATHGKYEVNLERNVSLNVGKNKIALLSVTVGLPNYGAFYDNKPTGVTGPVAIVGTKGDETVTKDLSSHKWTYKVGLNGIDQEQLFSNNSNATQWRADSLPTNKMMTWYKTTFKPPLGKDPVVVDLSGMGKGFAWVNGQNIGRYWSSFLADDKGCSLDPCDYRGKYDNNKCVTNCGQPSQTWYHVPRSYLRDGLNTLVLFEEFGGNPTRVNFQTVVVGGGSGSAYEGKKMELRCEGRSISKIKFASYGDPQGVFGSFGKGTCHGDKDALNILNQACLGKETCSLEANDKIFGSTNCGDKSKRLVVEFAC